MKTQTKLTLTLAAAAALMMTGCGGGGSSDNADAGSNESTAQYVPFDAPPIDEATKQAYLNAVNAARAVGHTCGEYGYFPPAPPVQWDDALYRAAAEHNYDMASSNFFEHDGSGTASDWTAQVLDLARGSRPDERTVNNGFSGMMGENIYAAKGDASLDTAQSAVNWWLNSPPHCSGMMDATYNVIGLAHLSSSGSDWDGYWTLELGSI